MDNLQELIASLAQTFTECEKLGYKINISIAWVHKEIIQKLVKEYEKNGSEYRSKISWLTYGEQFASGDVHFDFGKVLFFDKQP